MHQHSQYCTASGVNRKTTFQGLFRVAMGCYLMLGTAGWGTRSLHVLRPSVSSSSSVYELALSSFLSLANSDLLALVFPLLSGV